MNPTVRRFALTSHVTVSVGWIGAVTVFLALAGLGLTSEDPFTVRGVYLVMEHAAWLTLVPMAFATLVTGLVMSLGTSWGLFRLYWVVFELVITVFATTVLLVYMQTFRHMAAVAADPGAELQMVRNPSPLLHAVLALVIFDDRDSARHLQAPGRHSRITNATITTFVTIPKSLWARQTASTETGDSNMPSPISESADRGPQRSSSCGPRTSRRPLSGLRVAGEGGAGPRVGDGRRGDGCRIRDLAAVRNRRTAAGEDRHRPDPSEP